MTSDQFIYWLQGHIELLEDSKPPTEKQWVIIKDHLALVFDKQTPNRMQPDIIKIFNPVIKPLQNKPTTTC